MNILVFGDLHLNLSEIEECREVLDEIASVILRHKISRLIINGDIFDSFLPKNGISRPTPQEFDLFSSFLKKVNLPTLIIVAKSHESENEEISILNHFGILNDQVKICSEFSHGEKLYVGHFTLNESKYNYGATKGIKDFIQYKRVLLSHQHTYEVLSKNVIHIGSPRRIDFAESQDPEKGVYIIEDFDGVQEKGYFLPLKSPYKMVSYQIGERDENNLKPPTNKDLKGKLTLSEALSELNKLPEKTKIRLIFTSYSSYREWLGVKSNYDNKFQQLKIVKEFKITDQINVAKRIDNLNFEQSFKEWLNKQNLPSEIKEILLFKEKE